MSHVSGVSHDDDDSAHVAELDGVAEHVRDDLVETERIAQDEAGVTVEVGLDTDSPGVRLELRRLHPLGDDGGERDAAA